jgi:hypothetical protein
VTLVTNARVRLALLLLVAAGLGAYAFTTLGGGANGDVPGWCEQPTGAASLVMSAARLQVLAQRVGLGRIGIGAPVAQGIAGPNVAWTDARPVPADVAPAGGGYEMAWRGAGGSVTIADVFPFASAADAGDYAQKAGHTACRAEATSQPLTSPANARTVTWTGPRGRRQSDVFLARGRNAFRISVIAPTQAARPAAPVALARRVGS